MTVLFRADADDSQGAGHVMRSMALALRLKASGFDVHLVARHLPPTIREWLDWSGLPATEIDGTGPIVAEEDVRSTRDVISSLGDISHVVVDHYEIDAEWETAVGKDVGHIWVIDDLAERSHRCEVLIDPGLHSESSVRYDGRVPDSAVRLLGPTFAFLRPEFDEPGHPRSGAVNRILVYLGGGDRVPVELFKILEALDRPECSAISTTVLLGPLSYASSLLTQLRSEFPTVDAIGTSTSVASLMRDADLSIGTCGAANWERCAVGLPALTVLTAENQRDDAVHLSERAVVRHLGDAQNLNVDDWVKEIIWSLSHPEEIAAMGERGRLLVPGWRTAGPIIEELLRVG